MAYTKGESMLVSVSVSVLVSVLVPVLLTGHQSIWTCNMNPVQFGVLEQRVEHVAAVKGGPAV